MLRFLVDESATIFVTEFLRDRGYDVAAVSELSPSIPDTEVLRIAHEQSRILITADKDFGELVFRRDRPHAGILFLRPSEDRPSMKIDVVRFVLANYSDWLANSFVVASENSVRIRSRR